MSATVLATIPGGNALFEWFGRTPNFHDAEVQEIKLASSGPSTLRVRTWEITNTVDSRGYFVLDKHVLVTFTLEEVSYIALDHFNLPGIVFDLEVTNVDGGFQVRWSGSYGVEGALRAKKCASTSAPQSWGVPPLLEMSISMAVGKFIVTFNVHVAAKQVACIRANTKEPMPTIMAATLGTNAFMISPHGLLA